MQETNNNQYDFEELGLENAEQLLTSDFPPDAYWLPTFLPKSSIMLMGGQAKIGKSWLVGNMARSLVLGEAFLPPEPGYRTGGSIDPRWKTPVPMKPCRVLVIDKEVGRRSLKNRISSVLEEDYATNPTGTSRLVRENYFLNSKDSGREGYIPPSFSTAEGEEKLHMLCDAVKPQVLILDPIGKMNHHDENSAGQIQQLYDKIEKVQHAFKKYEMSILIIHHFGKPQKAMGGGPQPDPLDHNNFRGSSKWGDLPDGLITCARMTPTAANSTRPVGQMGWDIQMRIRPRHDEEMPTILLGVNQRGDKRIYFRKTLANNI
jgi:hypothetical protein